MDLLLSLADEHFVVAGTVLIGVGVVALLALRGLRGDGGAASPPSAGSPAVASPPNPVAPAKGDAAAVAAPAAAADMRPVIRFIWGSQTGTAAGFAKKLVKAAAKYGLLGESVDAAVFSGGGGVGSPGGAPPSAEAASAAADAARASLASPCVAVFLLATYGEGDPTDNAAGLVAWLTARGGGAGAPAPAAAGACAGLRYAVFGLGNRQYEHFNRTGRVVDAALATLGGSRVHALGLGDDDGTMEEDFERWCDAGLWDALRSACAGVGGGAGAGGVGAAMDAAASAAAVTAAAAGSGPAALEWRLTIVDGGAGAAAHAPPSGLDPVAHAFFSAARVRVVENRELRQAPSRGASTRHIELCLEGSTLGGYGTADNLLVSPENDAPTVERVAARLGYDLDAVFVLSPAAPSATGALFPTPCSVRDALTRYLDLHGAPRQALLGDLAPYAREAGERAALARLGSKAGRAEFAALVTAPAASFAELLLHDFPSLAPPLEAFVQLAPRLHPRAYTIASSAAARPGRIALCASVLDVPKPPGARARGDGSERRHVGVASSHLARTPPGGTLLAAVRPSAFRLPTDPAAPVVMVGPGTGIAPFVAFLEERAHARAQGARAGEALLFFGCRARDEDYLYRDFLAEAARAGDLTALHVAFSREQREKVYVQHLLAREGAPLWQLLHARGAHVYVCGATRMGADVLAAFERIAQTHGGLAPDKATAYVRGLQATGRYVQELWSTAG